MMKRWIIRARGLATEGQPLEDKLVVISGKRIESILPSTAASRFSGETFISAQRYLVFPGLVDLHCHGGGGADVRTLGGLLAASYFHASHGTTAMMLSILYEGATALARMVELVKEARSQAPLRLLGLHLEGPFLNPEMRGAIPEEAVRPIRRAEIEKILKAGQDELKVITLAPELPGAKTAIQSFRQAGVVVAMGHSAASAEQAQAAADEDVTLVTHLGNAMSPWHQRQPGLVGAALHDPRLYAEIIADGLHLAPETLSMFMRGKMGELILVSDCRWVAGLPDGEHHQPEGETLWVKNGLARKSDGTLAGGIYPLWKGVTTIAGLPGFNVYDGIRLATRNPARVLGKKSLGRISVGGRVDLVLAGPDLTVRRVFVGGEEIFRAEHEPPLPK